MRTRVSEIREAGRNTMGVKLIELAKNEKLQDIARVINQGDDEEAPAGEAEAPADAGAEGEPPANGPVDETDEAGEEN